MKEPGLQKRRAGQVLAVTSAIVVMATATFMIATWPDAEEVVALAEQQLREQNPELAERRGAARQRAIEQGAVIHSRTDDSRGPPQRFMFPTFAGAVLAVAGALTGYSLLLVPGFVVGFFWYGMGLYLFLLAFGFTYQGLVGVGEVMYLVAAYLISSGNRQQAASL